MIISYATPLLIFGLFMVALLDTFNVIPDSYGDVSALASVVAALVNIFLFGVAYKSMNTWKEQISHQKSFDSALSMAKSLEELAGLIKELKFLYLLTGDLSSKDSFQKRVRMMKNINMELDKGNIEKAKKIIDMLDNNFKLIKEYELKRSHCEADYLRVLGRYLASKSIVRLLSGSGFVDTGSDELSALLPMLRQKAHDYFEPEIDKVALDVEIDQLIESALKLEQGYVADLLS